MSKVLFIDYENVQAVNLTRMEGMDCKVCVFTGSAQSKIPIDLVTSAQALGSRLEWIGIDGNGPNALDFHIAYYLGFHIAKDPSYEYYILSRDKGFDPLVRHVVKLKVVCRRITSLSEIDLPEGPVSRKPTAARVLRPLIPPPRQSAPRRRPIQPIAKPPSHPVVGRSASRPAGEDRRATAPESPKDLAPKRTKEADGVLGKVTSNLRKTVESRRPSSRKALRRYLEALVGKLHTSEELDRLVEQLFSSRLITEESGRLTYRV